MLKSILHPGESRQNLAVKAAKQVAGLATRTLFRSPLRDAAAVDGQVLAVIGNNRQLIEKDGKVVSAVTFGEVEAK